MMSLEIVPINQNTKREACYLQMNILYAFSNETTSYQNFLQVKFYCDSFILNASDKLFCKEKNTV